MARDHFLEKRRFFREDANGRLRMARLQVFSDNPLIRESHGNLFRLYTSLEPFISIGTMDIHSMPVSSTTNILSRRRRRRHRRDLTYGKLGRGNKCNA